MITSDLILRNARRIPERAALVVDGKRFTWGEINTRINRLANVLTRLGVGRRDRVVYQLDNSSAAIETRYAIAKIGATGVPIVPGAVGREIVHIANDVGAKLLIVAAPFAKTIEEIQGELKTAGDAIGVGTDHGLPLDYDTITYRASIDEPGIDVDPDTICNIEYTSGTTGVPKGCMISHRATLINTMLYLAQVPHRREDRGVIGSPRDAGFGGYFFAAYAVAGAVTHLLPNLDPALLLDTIEREGISIAHMTQSGLDSFTRHPDLDAVDLSSLRLLIGSSGSKDTVGALRRLIYRPGFGADFVNAYGSAEAGGYFSYHLPADFENELEDPALYPRVESIGREGLLCRIECHDEEGKPVPTGEFGELAVQAPFIFSGYWNMPEETARVKRDGWLVTGDLVRSDENGFLYLAGSKRDVIETGGTEAPARGEDDSDLGREVLVSDGVA